MICVSLSIYSESGFDKGMDLRRSLLRWREHSVSLDQATVKKAHTPKVSNWMKGT